MKRDKYAKDELVMMLSDKLKNLVPTMEKFIKISEVDKLERGFTFRINKEAKMEELCETGNECQIVIKDIKKREGTKIGSFHTHPHTTMRTKETNAIGEVFSCSDILLQATGDIDHQCVGTKDEIVCSTLKLRIPSAEKFDLLDCASFHHSILRRERETKDYKGSEMQKNDIKKLDKLERELDTDLKTYIDFDIIKTLRER